MLTNEGKNHIRRFLAGYTPLLAQSVAVGIGNRAEVATDAALQLEVARSQIESTYYDFVNNDLIFKAAVPTEFSGKIYEVGIYSLETDPSSGEFSSRNLVTFDSATEDWAKSDGSYSDYATANARVGDDALTISPAASGSITNYLKEIELDLSGYSSADAFVFAYNNANSDTSSLRFRFLTDATNYYDFILTEQTAGYKIVEVTKGSAVATGVPSWTNITEIQVTVNSGAGGAAVVDFDAIRIEDKDAAALDYILVARKVLATPVTKLAGVAHDIEFPLDVTL